jgi:hypothetical protein
MRPRPCTISNKPYAFSPLILRVAEMIPIVDTKAAAAVTAKIATTKTGDGSTKPTINGMSDGPKMQAASKIRPRLTDGFGDVPVIVQIAPVAAQPLLQLSYIRRPLDLFEPPPWQHRHSTLAPDEKRAPCALTSTWVYMKCVFTSCPPALTLGFEMNLAANRYIGLARRSNASFPANALQAFPAGGLSRQSWAFAVLSGPADTAIRQNAAAERIAARFRGIGVGCMLSR